MKGARIMASDKLPSALQLNRLSGLLIFAFGGHARSVADVALAMGVEALCFVDNKAREGETFMGFPVVAEWDAALPDGWSVFSAMGDNKRRQKQCKLINSAGWPLATLVAPSATVGVGSIIGPGCLIGHHAHVGPAAKIGMGCIINTGAIVEHECVVADFAHISVNATVAGRSRVGRFSMIGAGATVIDNVEVAEDVLVGAGGLVLRSIQAPGVYVGTPIHKLG